jgi:cytochrome c peroxidase
MALEVSQQSPADFYPFSSKYDAFLRKQVSLSAQELRGLALFNDPRKGNCASCHPSSIKTSGPGGSISANQAGTVPPNALRSVTVCRDRVQRPPHRYTFASLASLGVAHRVTVNSPPQGWRTAYCPSPFIQVAVVPHSRCATSCHAAMCVTSLDQYPPKLAVVAHHHGQG